MVLYYIILYYIILYYIILYYNIMGPPSYMRSVVEKNIVIRRIPVYEFGAELLYSQYFTNAKRFAVPTYARRLTVPPSGCARSWVLPITNLAGDQTHQLARYCLRQIAQDRQRSIFCDVSASRTRFVRRVFPDISRGSSEGTIISPSFGKEVFDQLHSGRSRIRKYLY